MFKSKRKDNLKRHHRKCHETTISPASHGNQGNDSEKIASPDHRFSQIPDVKDTVQPYGSSILLQVAASRDTTRLVFLLDEGLSVETRASDGSTLLHCAARAGQATTVECLLARGASCDALNDSSRLPVHEAIISGDTETFTLLFRLVTQEQLRESSWRFEHSLAHSGNLDIVQAYIERLEKTVATHAMDRVLSQAARLGQHLTVAALCNYPDIDTNQILKRNAPIHYAARHGRTKVMEVLLALDRTDARMPTQHLGMHALHIAAINGHTDVVELLLGHGKADPNCLNSKRQTPLHLAAAHGRIGVVQALLHEQNMDLSCLDRHEKMPIQYAVTGWHWGVVDLLLRYLDSIDKTTTVDVSPMTVPSSKADVLQRLFKHPYFENPNAITQGSRRQTLLQRAAEKGDCDVIRALLARKGIEVNKMDNYESPLMIAAQHGQLEAVSLLLQHEDIDINQSPKWDPGWTALKYARSWKHDEIVRILLSHGAIDYEANTPTTVSTAATVDNLQSAALQPNNELQFEPFDDDMKDVPDEAWEEFMGMEAGMAT
jgi:ankyrin repeat protein